MIDLKHIAVLGLGVSNRSLVREMLAAEVMCSVWDDGAPEGFELTTLTDGILSKVDALVVAPGIAPSHEVVVRARSMGVDVMCDVELWGRLNPEARVIGITGTNGKSTVTAMVTHGLKAAGVHALMGGNIGVPVFDLPRGADWYVLEMSSYQIEYCSTFRPAIAALLNLSQDHLDRHGTMEDYAGIKARIFDSPLPEASARQVVRAGVIAIDDEWTRSIAAARDLIEVSGDGSPAAQNEAVAAAVVRAAGVETPDFSGFSALPHRQSVVRVLDGVTYINDSKATNVEAARAALSAHEDIHWIIGGQVKAGGYAGLEDCVAGVVQAYVIGEDMSAAREWLEARGIEHMLCGTMSAAVEAAYRRVVDGDVVLLSPAAASFDQYKNFELRGLDFEECVEAL